MKSSGFRLPNFRLKLQAMRVKRISVLLIEDNPGDSRLIIELLKEEIDVLFGCTVANSLKEGKNLMKLNQFDIILLDLSLPDSTGVSTFEKALSFSRNVPVIVLTGMGDNELALEAVRIGAQDYLHKNNLYSELLIKSILFAIERKRIQEELQLFTNELEYKVTERTKELANALNREVQIGKMKSSFVTMASHEFRTPLAGIMSSVHLIQEYGKRGDIDRQNKHTDKIKKSVKHLVNILDDFLSIEQFEQGSVTARTAEFNLNALIREVISEIASLTSIDQGIIFDPSGVQNIYSDEKIVKNILVNLLSNAIKYSEEDVYIGTMIDEGGIAQIEVTDRGVGIPVEDQENLFGKFFRAANVNNFQGTGLGLYIVKHYVEIIQGEISFTSQPSHETKFTVRIPISTLRPSNG